MHPLYADRLAAGSSPTTVQHLHRALYRALVMAERWEMVNRNVARLVTPPRVPRFKIKPLTPDKVRRLFVAASGHGFEAAFVVAVVPGLRLGELLALRDWATSGRTRTWSSRTASEGLMAPDYFVRKHFARLLEAARLPRIRFHDLRHTFATLQLAKPATREDRQRDDGPHAHRDHRRRRPSQ